MPLWLYNLIMLWILSQVWPMLEGARFCRETGRPQYVLPGDDDDPRWLRILGMILVGLFLITSPIKHNKYRKEMEEWRQARRAA